MAKNPAIHTPLQDALYLASNGIKVIELHYPTHSGCSCGRDKCVKSIGKHPVRNDWAKHATDDIDEIKRIWSFQPWNIGVPMGSINGIFALDIDGREGWETVKEWNSEYGPLPDTWQIVTGGGGIQFWFKIPDGLVIPNSVKKIGINVDIRGEGGQSVAPGSLHKSGRLYAWAEGKSPSDIDAAEPPEWLIRKIKEIIEDQEKAKKEGLDIDSVQVAFDVDKAQLKRKIEELTAKSKAFRDDLSGAKSFGSPSQRDMSLANICAVNGWEDAEIVTFLYHLRKQRGEDTKHPLYYQLTVAKARKWANEQKQAEVIPLFPDTVEVQEEEDWIPLPEKIKVASFPINIFPEPFKRYILEASESLGLPPDFVGVHFLISAGSAIGKSYEIEIKEGYRQLPNLYGGVIGDTGLGKSPALGMAFYPVAEFQNENKAKYDAEKELYEEEMAEYEAQMNQWRQSNKKGEKPMAPQAPVMHEVYSTQATVEAIAKMLKFNPRGIILKMDELSALVKGMNQYKGGKGDDLQKYLSFWANADEKINRARDPEPTILRRPFVAITGNLPPDILPTLSAFSGEEDGFIDRFLLSYPDEQPLSDWTWKGVSREVSEEYKRHFDLLYALSPQSYETNDMISNTIYLSDGSRGHWQDWYNSHMKEMRNLDIPEKRLRGPFAKMTNQLARITLILHMLRHVCGEVDDKLIDVKSVLNGIQMVEYFKSHARKIYNVLSQEKEDKRVEQALEFIKKQGGTASKRDFQRNKIAGCKKGSDVDELFAELQDRGYGRIETIKPTRGRASTAFVLYSK